jgi:hypothetical protein
VSLNYPNPFNYETRVFFSINESTPIKMRLYNSGGSLIQIIPNDNPLENCLNYYIYDSHNAEIFSMDNSYCDDYEFAQGLYKIVFRVNRTQMNMGTYRLVIETRKNNYIINIIFSN